MDKKTPKTKTSKAKKIAVAPEMFLGNPCKMWNFDGGFDGRQSLETAYVGTPDDYIEGRGFSWGNRIHYVRDIALVSDESITMHVEPKKAKVRIQKWFDSPSACWEGEIEETGSTSENLGSAVKAALKAGADLRSADLRSADLQGADLRSADLRSADLRGADLRSADLRSADLRGANLRGADLRSADLQGADLQGINLRGADLRGANLQGAKDADLIIARTRILPEGSLIGWKKLQGEIIAKLRIPEAAKRSHAFGRKCRAEFAEVLELTKNGVPVDSGTSQHDNSFVYRVGETVRPKNGFSENWMEECDPGIHFFISKIEAENY
jgi:hypothetical protein